MPRSTRRGRPLVEDITLDEVVRTTASDLLDEVLWPESRLNAWAKALEHVVFVAIVDKDAPILDDYPRAKGLPTQREIDALGGRWTIAREVTVSAVAWVELVRWACLVFYPTYAERQLGHVHPSWERVAWMRANLPAALLPPMVLPWDVEGRYPLDDLLRDPEMSDAA